MEYRATVGTLYRENRKSLNKIAKKEKFRGYTSVSRNDSIQTIFYHRRVVKPLLRGPKQLIRGFTKDMLRKQANKEGLLRVGGTKRQMIENLATHRIAGEYESGRHVVNWVNHKEHVTPVLHQHAIHDVFTTFRLNGIEKMDVDTYLKLVKKHLRKLMKDQVNEMGSIKVPLILEVGFISQRDGDIIIKYPKSDPITVLQGSNMGEILNEAYNTLEE